MQNLRYLSQIYISFHFNLFGKRYSLSDQCFKSSFKVSIAKSFFFLYHFFSSYLLYKIGLADMNFIIIEASYTLLNLWSQSKTKFTWCCRICIGFIYKLDLILFRYLGFWKIWSLSFSFWSILRTSSATEWFKYQLLPNDLSTSYYLEKVILEIFFVCDSSRQRSCRYFCMDALLGR